MKKFQAIFVVALAASVATANTETTTNTTAPAADQNAQTATTTTTTTTTTKAPSVAKKKMKRNKMMMKKKAAETSSIMMESAAPVAAAATETPVVTTQAAPMPAEASRTTVAPRFVDNVILSDALYFYGPGVRQMDLNQPGDYAMDSGDNLTFENILTLGYRAIDDVSMSVNINTLHTPFGAGDEKDYTFRDPYFRVRKSNIINSGGFNFAADMRFYAPVSDGSRARNQTMALRSTQYAKYTIGRWTAVMTTFVRHNAFEKATGPSWALLAAPALGYQISPTLSAGLYYEMYTVHNKATNGFTSDFDAGASTGLEPSISWDISPAVTLTPYLRIKTGGRISWETTSANLLLTASIL